MTLLNRVERYLKRSDIPATVFGREALGDPNLVRELRNGREPRPHTLRRLHAFLDRAEAALGGAKCRR